MTESQSESHRKLFAATDTQSLFLGVIASLAVMLPWIWSPSLNLEYVFLQGAHSLIAPSAESPIADYFAKQANPLGMSLLAGVATRALSILPELTSSRLPNVIGLTSIVYLGWLGLRRSNSVLSRFLLWSSFIALNPIVLPYAVRLSADVLPAALVFASFTVTKQVVDGCRESRLWLAPLLIFFAAMLKYNSLYFLFGVTALLVSNNVTEGLRFNKRKLPAVVGGTALGALTFALFVTWQYRISGILLLNNEFRSIHSLRLDDPLTLSSRGFRYLAFLSLLMSPMLAGRISSTVLPLRKLAVSILIGVPTFFLARLDDPTGGELDFGGLIPRGSWLDQLLILLGCILTPLLVWSILRVSRRKDAVLLLAYVVVPLVVMSFARPAQRYLIPIVVIVSFVLASATVPKAPALLAQSFAIVLMTIPCFALVGYQNGTAVAADRMAQWIQDRQLLEVTRPDDIQPHAGQYWVDVKSDEPQFKVTKLNSQAQCQLHETPISLFGVTIGKYCLKQV